MTDELPVFVVLSTSKVIQASTVPALEPWGVGEGKRRMGAGGEGGGELICHANHGSVANVWLLRGKTFCLS